MAFVGHVLRNGDLFIDVGANVGAYTILAAAWCEATVISVEPSPSTFSRLSQNVRLNDVMARVELHQVAVGDRSGEAILTTGMDTMNHLLVSGAGEHGITVQMRSLEDIVNGRTPFAIKIDVEGFEVSVLSGGQNVLARSTLQALIVEMNGSGKLFGHEDEEVHRIVASHGFIPVSYDPFTRTISSGRVQRDNQIYVRDLETVQLRVRAARPIVLPHDRTV
jgi:FkbM family methyltransferase